MITKHRKRDIRVYSFLADKEYAFLYREARRRGITESAMIRTIIQNAIRDAKEVKGHVG